MRIIGLKAYNNYFQTVLKFVWAAIETAKNIFIILEPSARTLHLPVQVFQIIINIKMRYRL